MGLEKCLWKDYLADWTNGFHGVFQMAAGEKSGIFQKPGGGSCRHPGVHTHLFQ